MVCTGCGQDKPTKARGMCAACYTHWQKYGTTERVRTRGQKGGPCSVEGCTNTAHGRGLCHMHLRRERKTGSLADPRENQPAPLTHHRLYPQWIDYQRTNNPRPVVPEWKASFETFLAGVGQRPSDRHRLYRIDKTKPMGPGNFEWRLALVEKQEGESALDYNKRYRRAHRETYGTDYHANQLRSRYDISFETYQEMLKAQEHKCALCGQPETELRGGIKKGLAVDHDHKTGKVRALLCTACNTGLGKFKDDISLLAAAIAYLQKHSTAA
jgi:hypothetical protein